MPNKPTDAEGKLRKLGERLRDGWTKQHPTLESSLETVRSTVREQWEQEANRGTTLEPDSPSKPERKPPEPGLERYQSKA